jgi:exodeoxyribonuclease VII large subunit
VSSLFDLPFEEPEPEPEPANRERANPEPGTRNLEPALERERRVYTVAQLTARIRALLEREYFEIWVEGELSNCRVWNTGHLYFTLKDTGAQLKAVMFKTALARLRFKPQDGLRVVARGRVSVYDPKGEYQIVCEHLEPAGVGARMLAFEQLKERLAKAGLFDQARKRPLPALPRKIGVVTSLDGAVVRDIIQVLRRRYGNAHIVIRPTRVQGDNAELDIKRGILAIGKVPGVDVVIIARGGGSIEDLWAFNEEVVAYAIAGCPVPTIAAVGHETDVTIADFVADVRAPTPSAAAELVVARKDDFQAGINRLTHRLGTTMRTRLAMRERHAAELTHDLSRIVRARLSTRERRYQSLRLTLETFDLRRRFAGVRTRLVAADGHLLSALRRRTHAADGRLRTAAARLDSLSPLAVLGRGYAVCWNQDRTRILRDASAVAPGDGVRVTLERGELHCEVKASDPKPGA